MDWGWLFLLVPLGFFALLAGVAVWEKQRVVNYVTEVNWQLDPPPRYLVAMRRAADARRFVGGTQFRHERFPQMRAAMWFSNDRAILMQSGAGRIVGAFSRQTWLYSRLSNGRILVTSDDYGEGDPSGLYILQFALNGDLDELLAKHRARIGKLGVEALPFAEETPEEAQLLVLVDHAQRLVDRGRARWRDEERTVWSYTPWGAVWVVLGFFPQLLNGITHIWRAKKPRPGD